MKITRTSSFTGITRTMDLFGVTEAQMRAFENGALVQRAFPQLTSAEREFILTGITDDEWNTVFGKEDD
jgi:hypothetical protein